MISTHQVRCTGCAVSMPGDKIPSDFRCAVCGSLFEVVYPWSAGSVASAPNPSALRWLWQERRTSSLGIDQSGVWRFRDLLPIVRDLNAVTTLREGNTPLYEMPRAAKALGIHWILAKHQGMNPTGSFKDCGMTAALSVAVERGFQWVACASTGNTSAAMAAYAARAGLRSIVFIPDGKIAWGKLSQAMDYGALTVQLRTDFDGCVKMVNELVRTHPIYLLNSVNPYRLEGQKTPAFELLEQMELAGSGACDCAGGEPGELVGAGQGFCGDAATRADCADAEDLDYSGRGRESAVSGDAGERRRIADADEGGDAGRRRYGSAIQPRGIRRLERSKRPADGASRSPSRRLRWPRRRSARRASGASRRRP